MRKSKRNKNNQPKELKMPAKKSEAPAIITDPKTSHIMRMSVDEYREWSQSQGYIMGRKPDQVTIPSEEEMRVLINSGYTRAMVKEKHGLNDEQINKILQSMSYKERRDKTVTLH